MYSLTTFLTIQDFYVNVNKFSEVRAKVTGSEP